MLREGSDSLVELQACWVSPHSNLDSPPARRARWSAACPQRQGLPTIPGSTSASVPEVALQNELIAPKISSLVLLWGKPTLRHHSLLFFFHGTYHLLTHGAIYFFTPPLFIVYFSLLVCKPWEDRQWPLFILFIDIMLPWWLR